MADEQTTQEKPERGPGAGGQGPGGGRGPGGGPDTRTGGRGPGGGGPRGDRPGGDRGGPRGDRPGGDRGGDRGDRGDRRGFDRGRPEGPPEIELEKLMSDSLYLDNQAHAIVSRMRDMDSGTKSQLRRLYSAVRRAVRAPEGERQHEFVMLRAR